MKPSMFRLNKFVDVDPLLLSLIHKPELWKMNTERQDHKESYHKDTETIFLRGPRVITLDDMLNSRDTVDYPALHYLPDARNLVCDLMAYVHGVELGRAMIIKLKAGGVISAHKDSGKYPEEFDRFHIPLYSLEGNTFKVGDREAWMVPGDIWWIDNKQTHAVLNNSNDDRVHLVVDIRT